MHTKGERSGEDQVLCWGLRYRLFNSDEVLPASVKGQWISLIPHLELQATTEEDLAIIIRIATLGRRKFPVTSQRDNAEGWPT